MNKFTWILLLILPVFFYAGAQEKILKQPLQVSKNHRFLTYKNGTPFFYLGDTAWELFHRLNKDEARNYFKNRKEKGFTVIQAVVLAELYGLKTPNAFGHLPLKNLNPETPNEVYFKDVDWFIKTAAEYGLFIGLLPTWGDKIFKDKWGAGPEIFTPENASVYGEYLGRRYRNQWNIIWIMGGDRNPSTENQQNIWRKMAEGVERGVGGKDKALMSFHPQPTNSGGSSTWFHNDDWLDFNMNQTGHCRDGAQFQKITHDYNLKPVKPTMDAEPLYEEHPVCFDAKKNGYSNADDIRKLAWWQVFAGAMGHTYGCHAVWQMYSQKVQPTNGPLHSWQQSLDLPGATQMGYLKKLILSRSFLSRIPDQEMVSQENPTDSSYIAATRDSGGRYAFLYTPTGKTLQVKTEKLKGERLKVTWYNPRTGIWGKPAILQKEPVMAFKPATSGFGQDWVLVLDAR